MDYDAELEFAKKLALEAGEIARKYFLHDIAFEEKSDSSPVTLADIEINQLVIDRIRSTYPGIGVIGEEISEPGTDEHRAWVCDPIDGTIPYALGIPVSTFCLALVVDGAPEVGVIYDFHSKQLFSAVRGGQAFLNDKPVRFSPQSPMKVVELGWYHAAAYNLTGVREKLFVDNFQVTNYASYNYFALRVATGRAAGAIYASDSPWDVAAAKVILEACGGIVTDLSGKEQRYDRPIKGAVIAHADYHEYLVKLVSK